MDASGHEYMELKQRVCAANREISRTGLAILTWGHVSEVDRDAGVFAIKPSGVAYDDLSPDDIVLVSIDTGEKLQGKLAPSSDSATHAEIYRSFGAVGGVVHTHSHFGTAWAQAQREIPCYGTTHADTFFGPVPVTRMLSEQEVKDAYEVNTGKVIVERFHDGGLDPIAVPGVLVAGHAPFAWGQTAAGALENALVLEEVARMALHTLAVAPATEAVPQYLLDKHYLRKHGKDAYYGQK